MARRSAKQIQLDADVESFNVLKAKLREAGFAIVSFSPGELSDVRVSQKLAESLMEDMVNGDRKVKRQLAAASSPEQDSVSEE